MSEPQPTGDTRRDLDFEAFLYATRQLNAIEQTAFEQRLGCEPQAREALSRTMQEVLTLAGPDAPAPQPAYRAAVRRKLGVASPGPLRFVWHAMWGSYSYRGHPIFWVLVGGVAALLFLSWSDFGTPDDLADGEPGRVVEENGPARSTDDDTEAVSVPDDNHSTEFNAPEPPRVVSEGERRRSRPDEETDSAREPMRMAD